MTKIFLNYRHEDSGGYALAIYQQLRQHFGPESVFRDVDSMDFGVDFVEEIERAVGSCQVLVATIGPQWVHITDDEGQQRLAHPHDWVRLELETALARNIRVLPILVGGAKMPREQELPESLRPVTRRRAFVLSPTASHTELDQLMQSLEKVLGRSQGGTTPGPVEPLPPVPKEAKPPEGMVRIPKGSFLYGDDRIKENLTYEFWIDIHPVTNRQFAQFLKAGGYDNQAYWSGEGCKWRTEENITKPEYWDDEQFNQPDQPVVGVSYYEAEAYAKWAGKRLPTEQEWEKAARGTDGREYPWGEEFDADRCATSVKGKRKQPTPVGTFPEGASPFGCQDMAGNVWEWCASWYDSDKDSRVLRGGSWNYFNPEFFRCAIRDYSFPRNRFNLSGFVVPRMPPNPFFFYSFSCYFSLSPLGSGPSLEVSRH
ncbi:MAG: SUMF1/EgtB/PvdO family nonheme iron enzyme [Nitrospira sp.]|nr:SUMF1/EgtB/PvdO family nonheme iron enzyme [Nitrospira sp.]